MSELNSTVVDAVWLVGSNDYQQRVPLTSDYLNPQDGLDAVHKALTEPGNGNIWNEFETNLLVVVGKQLVHQLNWSNPLSVFKKDHFVGGKDFEEYAMNFIKGEAYSQEDTAAILRQNKVDVKRATYSVNRRVRYPITVNPDMLSASFVNGSNGLNDFLNATLNAPVISDQYDEYRFMLQAFAAANLRNAFTNIQVTIADPENPTEVEIKKLSRKLREVGLQMKTTPNGRYTGFGVPTISQTEDLVLITTPAIRASMSVDVLASAFNRDEADFVNDMILVDELPWADAWAILVDRKTVIAGDSLLSMTSFNNGATLTTNFWLHHHGGYAISPFGNVAVFSNSAASAIGVQTVEVTAITAKFVDAAGTTVTTAKPNSRTQLVVEGVGTIDPTNELFRIPGTWTAELSTSNPDGISSRNYVDSNGVLRLYSDVKAGDVITATVTAAYYNPSNPVGQSTTPITTEVTITVS